MIIMMMTVRHSIDKTPQHPPLRSLPRLGLQVQETRQEGLTHGISEGGLGTRAPGPPPHPAKQKESKKQTNKQTRTFFSHKCHRSDNSAAPTLFKLYCMNPTVLKLCYYSYNHCAPIMFQRCCANQH